MSCYLLRCCNRGRDADSTLAIERGLGHAHAKSFLAETVEDFVDAALVLARDTQGTAREQLRRAWVQGRGLERVFGVEAGAAAAREWSELLLRASQ